MSYPMPRVRARVGTCTEPPELAGKFAVEVSFWDLTGTERLGVMEPFGPFETEAQAKEEMRGIVDRVVKELQAAIGAHATGDVIDFKNGGVLRNLGKET